MDLDVNSIEKRRGPPAQLSDGETAPSQDMNNPLNTLIAARQVHLGIYPRLLCGVKLLTKLRSESSWGFETCSGLDG